MNEGLDIDPPERNMISCQLLKKYRTHLPILITLPKSQNHIRDIIHDMFRGYIHQVQSSFVIWFDETM